ncbi:MAG: TIGR02147 family protein [Deltaproteobacteria bacterium]|nr:TIGR02147 family protein [Deltaproteobacteria bacterium]
MKNSIFEHQDYKEYLREALTARSEAKRGERSRLAAFVGCHTAYVSQVLNGNAHFSLEQAERINRFLGHTKEQSLCLILLIQYARAGTKTLKDLFQEQLQALREKQFVLKNRLEFKKTLTREDQAIFYSSWHYGAIHVLVSVPGCHTERGMSEYLGVPVERIAEILQFLVSVGLVARTQDGHYTIGTSHIHLEHDSPMISKHHINWRLQAIQSLDRPPGKDLHYSSVITASRADADVIREILVKAIENVRAVVKKSEDQEGFCYAIDFFGLRGR